MLCGSISPKTTIQSDETINAIYPLVRSSSRIDIAEFTQTFPMSNVHKSRFPVRRIGSIASAY